MSPAWWTVFRKEMREILRDKRTLAMMIVVPVLLYPVILVASEQLLLFGMRSLEAEAAPVGVVGDAPDLVRLMEAAEEVRVVPVGPDPAAAIRNDSAAAVVVLGPPAAGPAGTRDVRILFDGASDASQRGRREAEAVLDAWRDTLLAERLTAEGLPPAFARPVEVADSSIARPEELGGYTLGRILPILLVTITLLGAFYPAIDLAAGEKERGTLETLLTAPVPARAVVTGKFVAVALVGVVAAGLNLASMLLTFQTGVLQVAGEIGLEVSVPLGSVAVIFLALVPLAVLFGAVFLGVAVRASSFKEAQNALTPVYMLVLIPAMLPIFPGIDFGPGMAVAPVANVAFLLRDLLAGDARPLLVALVLGSTVAYAAAALAFAARSFGSERVLFGGGDDATPDAAGPWWSRLGGGRRRGVPSVEAAALFVAAVAVLFFWLGITLQIRMGERGLLAAEWLLLLLPAVAFVALGGYDARRTLSLRAPAARHVLGAVLLVAGAAPVAWGIGWLQTFFLPIPWEILEGLEELVTADTPARLAWLLLLLAVTPALCEEVVFRGVLLGGTRSLSPRTFVLLNGVVFGAFHLSFETVIRFLPTAWLGIVITWAVWRSRSLWTGVLMHLLNNGTIVVLASVPALRETFADPDAPPPWWLVPLAVAGLAAGIRLLGRPPDAATSSLPLPEHESA